MTGENTGMYMPVVPQSMGGNGGFGFGGVTIQCILTQDTIIKNQNGSSEKSFD